MRGNMKSVRANKNILLLFIIVTISGLIGVVTPLVNFGITVNKYYTEFLCAFLIGVVWAMAVFLFERYRYLQLEESSQYRNTHLWKFAYPVFYFVTIYFRGEFMESFLIFTVGIYFLVLALIVFAIRKNQRILIN
jgi:hypothetical protein